MTIESDARNEFRFPRYTRGEVLADAAAHITGLALGLVATIWLLITASHLLAMLTCSAGYNLWPPSPMKELWRRFDHAAIFIMIAGTYTPLLLNRMGGEFGFGLLAFVWTAALGGAALKLAFPRRWESITLALYLGLGWSIVSKRCRCRASISSPPAA
jgi:hemolysin III